MSTISILSIVAAVWLLLSLATTVTLASIAARGHARRDDRARAAEAV